MAMMRITKLAAALGVGAALLVGGGAAATAMTNGGQGDAKSHNSLTGSQTKYQLTEDQKADLALIAEEEKLAYDLYTAFEGRYSSRIFSNISASESNHLQAMRTLLDRYNVADPTAGKGAGVFTNPDIQALYETLLARGEQNAQEAYKVGRDVELDDIAKLKEALDGVTASDVQQVYQNLLAASQNHLNAFERHITG